MQNPEKKFPEKDVAIQGNEISRSLYTCSVLARKIIAMASAKVQLEERDLEFDDKQAKIPSWIARFSITDFLEKFGMVDSGKNYQLVKDAIRECQDARITWQQDNGGFISFNWFYISKFNPDTNLVELVFSPDVGNAIYNMRLGYTALNFRLIRNFKSLYSFRYYEIAVSYMGNKGKNGNGRGQWFFEYDVESLRRTLSIAPGTYKGRMNAFINRVVKMPIDELNRLNFEFEIAFEKILSGRRTVGFRFTCTERQDSALSAEREESDAADKALLGSERDFFESHADELQLIFALMKSESEGLNAAERTDFSLMTSAKIELTKRYHEEWGSIHPESKNRG
jgi:plasmid replication initiation protein